MHRQRPPETPMQLDDRDISPDLCRGYCPLVATDAEIGLHQLESQLSLHRTGPHDQSHSNRAPVVLRAHMLTNLMTTQEHRNVMQWAACFHDHEDKGIESSVEQSTPVERFSTRELMSRYSDGDRGSMLAAPIVVTDALHDSQALNWSMSYLEAQYSEQPVVINDRAPARRADASEGRPQRTAQSKLGEYAAYIRQYGGLPYGGSQTSQPQSAPPFYLNGWNAPSQLQEIRQGFPEVHALEPVDHTVRILQQIDTVLFGKTDKGASSWAGQTNEKLNKLFIGPAGTVTRLHYDAGDAHGWLAQIEGSKLFVAYSPKDTTCLYQIQGETHTQQSHVDPLCPDHERYPLYKGASPLVAVVRPGECIVMPKGWWHYAVALEPSVTAQRNFYSADNAESLVKPILEAAKNARQAQQQRHT